MAAKEDDLRGAMERIHSAMNPEPPEEIPPATDDSPADEVEIDEVVEDTPEPEEIDDPEDKGERREAEADEDADDGDELDAEQFASMIGLDPDQVTVDDDGNVRFKTKVDGEESDATLSDLIERYQRDAHLTNRGKEVSELQKRHKQAVEQFETDASQRAQQAAVLLESLHNELNEQYSNIDWNQLKADDPQEYILQKQEYQERQQRLHQRTQEVLGQIQQDQKRLEAEKQRQQQERLAAEQQALHQAFKGLGMKVDPKLGDEIIGYLTSQFGEEETGNMLHHQYMVMAYKAMQFDKGKTRAQDKKVKKVPKVLKPGAKRQQSKSAIEAKQKRETRTRLKETGSLNDAAAALKGLVN